MIDPSAKLSVSQQAIVLGISRGSVYYKPRPVSITLEADFCIEAVEEALARHGTPEILNTDR